MKQKKGKQKNPARVASAVQLNERKKREAMEEAWREMANYLEDKDTGGLFYTSTVLDTFMQSKGITPLESENND